MATEKTKNVLSICTHYDDIVNFPFKENDVLTRVIIDEYTNTIFDVNSQDLGKTNHLKVVDIVVYEYLNDKKFTNRVKEQLEFNNIELNEESLIGCDIISLLITFYKEYKNRLEEEKEDTVWL